jgi:uncharacterized protein (DUF1810 family)
MALGRFHSAQNRKREGYAEALAEIRAGGKRSHWIWYVFPQMAGLGFSSMSAAYAIQDLEEARDYLRDRVLRQRYAEITGAVAEQIAGGAALEALMGGKTDTLKLVSSLTLFHAAAQSLGDPDLSPFLRDCGFLLGQAAELGYPPCRHTLEKLESGA